MSKHLAKPPEWRTRVFGIQISEDVWDEVDRAVRAADGRKRYLHWDAFRHRPQPAEMKAEDVWSLVRFSRSHRDLPLDLLRDKAGKPFRLVRDEVSSAILHRIDVQERLWKELSRNGESPDSEVSFRLMASIEEAHSSSVIEGAVTSRRSAQELIRTGREPKDRSEQMVLNNFKALGLVEERAEEPLTVEFLLELHRTVAHETLDEPEDVGRLRTDDEVRVFDSESGELVFTPPRASELPKRMERLCEFANAQSTEEFFLNPVQRAILLHHQLAYDHPFGDGNGRTARALCMWSLLNSGYHWFRSLSLSRAVRRSKSRYYRAFQEVQSDDGDVTYFVRQQLRCIEHEIDHLAQFLGRRVELERWLVDVKAVSIDLNARQVALVDYALKNLDAKFVAKEHAQFHGVSQPTAWKDLTVMRDQKLLTETKAGRKSIYSPSPKLVKLAKRRKKS